MTPNGTVYRIARSNDADDVSAVYQMFAREGFHKRMGWPVVVAQKNDGSLVGCLGTHDRQDLVMAGPMIAPNGIVAIRLMEAYENLLKTLGLREYMFFVSPKEAPRWLKVIRKTGAFEELEEDETGVWFRRTL